MISENSRRRGSVASLNSLPVAPPRNSIEVKPTPFMFVKKNSDTTECVEPESNKEVVCHKKGLKTIQSMLDVLNSKITKFEEQFKNDQHHIQQQQKEISTLKLHIQDIIDG